MLSFLERFDRFVADWPDNTKWTISQIAEHTVTDVPTALEAISASVDKFYDIHEPLTRREAENALCALRGRLQHQIEAQRRQFQLKCSQVSRSYESLMDKIRCYQKEKNWRHAYRSLTYFIGKNADYLSDEQKIEIYNDCLRLGIKSNSSVQELSQWLRSGIYLLLRQPSESVLEDALDFLDAYADYFTDGNSPSGMKVIEALTNQLIEPAYQFGMTPRLTGIISNLNLVDKEIA